MNMNISKNTKKENMSEFYIIVLIFSHILLILLLICPFFLQNPYAVISNDELLPSFLYKTFFFRGLTLDHMYYVGDFTSAFVISIYKILLFFTSIYSIFVLVFKYKFFKSDNQLTKAIQYMALSFSILIVSILNFYGGYLLGFGSYYPYIEMYYVIDHHEWIPVIIAILLIILDIPYLVIGIKEYRKNKKNSNTVKLEFKDKFKNYIKDYQNFTFIFLVVFSIVVYLIVFISNGGIEYPDPKQVQEYINQLR